MANDDKDNNAAIGQPRCKVNSESSFKKLYRAADTERVQEIRRYSIKNTKLYLYIFFCYGVLVFFSFVETQ